jgi:hypothetical protein
MKAQKFLIIACGLFTLASSTSFASLSLTLDFSSFGTSGAWANLHNDAWDGTTTDAVKQAAAESVMSAAGQYWETAFANSTTNLSHSISVQWGGLAGSTLATGGTGWFNDSPNYTLTGGQLNWDNDGSSNFFVDLTPADNSEYGKSSARTDDLGGGTVNVERIHYNPGPGTAARANADMLSVAIHEIGHALGFLGGYPKYAALDAGSDGDLDLTDGSQIIYSGGHHSYQLPAPETNFPYDGVTIGANPNYPTAMGPSIYTGTRKLLSAIDIQTMADIHSFDNVELNPLIPEPGTAFLLLSGTICLLRLRRR